MHGILKFLATFWCCEVLCVVKEWRMGSSIHCYNVALCTSNEIFAWWLVKHEWNKLKGNVPGTIKIQWIFQQSQRKFHQFRHKFCKHAANCSIGLLLTESCNCMVWYKFQCTVCAVMIFFPLKRDYYDLWLK